jgi:hypothetical protein
MKIGAMLEFHFDGYSLSVECMVDLAEGIASIQDRVFFFDELKSTAIVFEENKYAGIADTHNHRSYMVTEVDRRSLIADALLHLHTLNQ